MIMKALDKCQNKIDSITPENVCQEAPIERLSMKIFIGRKKVKINEHVDTVHQGIVMTRTKAEGMNTASFF